MKKILITILILLPMSIASAQKFYLGNYLKPTSNEFELIGISSKTGVYTYRYKKEIYDFFLKGKLETLLLELEMIL